MPQALRCRCPRTGWKRQRPKEACNSPGCCVEFTVAATSLIELIRRILSQGGPPLTNFACTVRTVLLMAARLKRAPLNSPFGDVASSTAWQRRKFPGYLSCAGCQMCRISTASSFARYAMICGKRRCNNSRVPSSRPLRPRSGNFFNERTDLRISMTVGLLNEGRVL